MKRLTVLVWVLLMLVCAFALSENELTVGVGQTVPLKSNYISVQNGNAVKIENDGTLTAVAPGVADVDYSDENGNMCSVRITVYAAPERLDVSGNPTMLAVGQSVELSVLSEKGDAVLAVWSNASPKVVELTEDGKVTGLNKGSTVLTAKSYNGKTATLKLTVAEAPTSLTISPAQATLPIGGVGWYSVTVNKNASNGCTFTSSDESIAVVDAGGKVTAVSAGECTITATSFGGLTATAVLRVSPAPTSARIIPETPVMGVGQFFTATVELEPKDALDSVTYKSSDPKLLSVDANGKVIALKEGDAGVIAVFGSGLTVEQKIHIVARPKSVQLSFNYNQLGVGESIQSIVSFSSGAYGSCTYKSKNPKVATVDEKGVVTGVSKGEATIEVTTYNLLTSSVKVYVKDAPTAVELSETDVTLGIGQVYSLFARTDTGANGIVFTTDNENILTVTKEGLITAVKSGSANVYATSYNGIIVVCRVTVCDAPDTVWLSSDKDVLGTGEIVQMTADVYPYGAQNIPVSYESSDDSVCAVNEAGMVLGIKPGRAVIRAYTYNGINCEMEFTVLAAPEKVELYTSGTKVAVNGLLDWTYMLPAGTSGEVTITVDRPDVLHVGDGVLMGLAKGEAVLSVATYNGKTASVNISVLEPADSISFDCDGYSLAGGQMVVINALPPEDTWAEIEYSIADESICTILPNSEILGLKTGETVLTATCNDGNVRAEARIFVNSDAETVDLSNSTLAYDARAALKAEHPEVTFLWSANVFGKTVLSTDTTLDLTKNGKIGSLDEVRSVLDAFGDITYCDLSYTKFSYEELARLREEYRGECKIVWTVEFCNRWSVRTDQTAFSTLLDDKSVHHSSKEFAPLAYCEDMLALDLGHNKIRDMSFLRGMPNLKILILAVNDVHELNIIGELTQLEYLELFTNSITDISPLANLTNLIDLNLSNNSISDISALLDLPNLERLWMTHNKLSDASKRALMNAHPNCEFNFTAPGPDRRGWRSHHRYFVVYKIFHINEWIPWETEVEPAPNYKAYY